MYERNFSCVVGGTLQPRCPCADKETAMLIEDSNAPTRRPTRSSFNVRGLNGSLRTDSMRAEPCKSPISWPWLLGLMLFDVQSRCPNVMKTGSKHFHTSRWTTDLVIGAWDIRPDDATDQFHVNLWHFWYFDSRRQEPCGLPLICKPANQEPPPNTRSATIQGHAGYLQHHVDAFGLLSCLWLTETLTLIASNLAAHRGS